MPPLAKQPRVWPLAKQPRVWTPPTSIFRLAELPDELQSLYFWPLIAGSVAATELASAIGLAAAKMAPALGVAALVAAPLAVKKITTK